MWIYWNSFPEVFATVPTSEDTDTVKELVELGGCSEWEAEAIAEVLEEAIQNGQLKEYNIIEGGVELYSPSKQFLESFQKVLKELNYSYELVKVKAPNRYDVIWG